MALFAKIGIDGVVERVIVADQEFVDSGAVGDAKGWKEVQNSDPSKPDFASVGHVFDTEKAAFMPPEREKGFILNKETRKREAPFPKPQDGKEHVWDNDTRNWKEDVIFNAEVEPLKP